MDPASDNPAVTIPAPAEPSPSHERSYQSPRLAIVQRQPSHTGGSGLDSACDHVQDECSPAKTTREELPKEAYIKPSKYEIGWRRVVRNFTPSWFSVTTGIGVVSLLFNAIPFKADWLYWLAVVFFALNTVLFALAFGISFARYTLYPEIWTVMIQDPINSLFLGTVTMGFSTLVECLVLLCCESWGDWSRTFAWVLWMIDSVAAFAVMASLSFILISQSHIRSLDRITAAQLLPIAATTVASNTGAQVATVIRNPQYAVGTLITSYVMWGMATPFAMVILVIYYSRLALHKLPSREVIVSPFLPLGPLGLGGNTILNLGKIARELLPQTNLLSHVPAAGDILYIQGLLIALIMWGFGIVWLVFALATIYSCRPFPFNMGWWGFTFPLGVFAISTIAFGVEMPSMFFSMLGTVMAVMVMLLWVVVAAGTAKGAWNGKLFNAPCLRNLEKPEGGDAAAEPEKKV